MTVKRGVVREAFTIVRLQSGVDRIRDDFPNGPELLIACEDDTEVVVTFAALPRLGELPGKTGRWSKLESDPLAAGFRHDGPAPQHEVTLSHLSLSPMDLIEVEGQLAEKLKGFAALSADATGHQKQHLLASKLRRVEAEEEARVPPKPMPVQAPMFVILPLAAAALWRAYLSHENHWPLMKSVTDIVTFFLLGLAFVIRRTRGARFFSITMNMPNRTSIRTEPRREWGFMNWTWRPDNQAFAVATLAVGLTFAMVFEQTDTKGSPAQGPWPIEVCFFVASVVMYQSEWGSRAAARLMLAAEPLHASTGDGRWGAVEGRIHAKKPGPITALGVPCVAVYSNMQKFVHSSSGTGTHTGGSDTEIDRGDLSFAQFSVESEGGAVWSVDPSCSVWASGGRVTPNSGEGADSSKYTLDFAEVIPADGRVLVVGRADKGWFRTQDIDGLYIFPAPIDGDPRAALRAYLRWSLIACLLPLVGILVTYL